MLKKYCKSFESYIFEVVVKLSTISAFAGPNGRNLSIEGKFKYLRFFLRLIVSGYRWLNYVLFIEIFVLSILNICSYINESIGDEKLYRFHLFASSTYKCNKSIKRNRNGMPNRNKEKI